MFSGKLMRPSNVWITVVLVSASDAVNLLRKVALMHFLSPLCALIASLIWSPRRIGFRVGSKRFSSSLRIQLSNLFERGIIPGICRQHAVDQSHLITK